MDIGSKIKEFFKGEITTTETDLEKYSRDASLFKIKPKIVVFPKDTEDLKNLVNFVAQNKKENSALSFNHAFGWNRYDGRVYL